MKYLEIRADKGYYWNDEEMVEIDRINKDDLLKLINHAEEDGFEMDAYEEGLLQNKAHQIIYQSIYLKLNDFLSDRERFNQEVDALYAEAVGVYHADLGTGDYDDEKVEDFTVTDDQKRSDLEDIPF